MDARAAQLEDLSANVLERREVEKLRTVIAEVALGAIAGLHAVGAYQHAGGGVAHHEVVADDVEAIAVEACGVGVRKAFAEFAVEYLIAEALAGDEVVHILCERKAEERSRFSEAFAVFD